VDAKWSRTDTGGQAIRGPQQHEFRVAVPDFRGLQMVNNVQWLGAGLEGIWSLCSGWELDWKHFGPDRTGDGLDGECI
jgi:hypothetical protein